MSVCASEPWAPCTLATTVTRRRRGSPGWWAGIVYHTGQGRRSARDSGVQRHAGRVCVLFSRDGGLNTKIRTVRQLNPRQLRQGSLRSTFPADGPKTRSTGALVHWRGAPPGMLGSGLLARAGLLVLAAMSAQTCTPPDSSNLPRRPHDSGSTQRGTLRHPMTRQQTQQTFRARGC